MTFQHIDNVEHYIKNCSGTPNPVITVWLYEPPNYITFVYIAYRSLSICDIFDRQSMIKPRMIYRSGTWLGKYKFLNR